MGSRFGGNAGLTARGALRCAIVPDFDPTLLRRVGGTGAGAYYELEPDIVVALPQKGYVQREPDARASLEEFGRIVRERGRRAALIVLVDEVRSQDAGSRRVWADEADPDLYCGLALVCGSALARAIGSFFMGLSRPRVRLRMFADLEAARQWAHSMVEEHGGPL